ncbi:bacteriohemerythrin [bacterium]|nr:bacteriohemerythrin [bacterium]
MEFFEWLDSYSIHNPNIDAEHQIFIKLINKLISAHNNGLDDNYCGRLSLEIQKYAEFHFVSEENFMIDIGYPLLDEHHEQHVLILEKFNVEMNYIELGQRSYAEFITFLVDWLTEHTLMQDKKIGNFVKK